ncbi:hypothetical protein B0H11DRAFT_867379 [Mycena galericulata]|nr:hypothetical protein B0H11DRAFT_867379 [Mycena galericulata]
MSAFTPFSSQILPSPDKILQLKDLLRSHSMPPDSSHFRSVAEASLYEIKRYDAEIARIRQVLVDLRAERATLIAYADGCRSLFSPIRRVPPEILLEIFELCSPPRHRFEGGWFGNPYLTYPTDRIFMKKLQRLTKVCSRWRQLAIGTPSLWTKIELVLDRWSDRRTQLLSSFLERSASLPLTINVRAFRDFVEDDGVGLILLAKHSDRWQTVSFSIFPAAFKFISEAKGRLPLLKTLEILMPPVNSPTSAKLWGIQPFENATSLENVLVPTSHPPTLPWKSTQFRRLDCYVSGREDAREALDIMSRRFEGTRFHFHLAAEISALSTSGIPEIISHIEHFEIDTLHPYISPRDPHRDPIGDILSNVTLPSVGILGISVPQFSFPRLQFLQFAARSSLASNLKTLSIEVRVDQDDLLQCLYALPSLTRLWIYDIPKLDGTAEHVVITDTLLRALSRTADPGCLIPSLKVLALTSLLRFDDDSLMDLAVSAGGALSIRLVRLWSARVLGQTVLTRLRDIGVSIQCVS